MPAWMNVEEVMLSEVSHTEKNLYHMISIVSRIKKKNHVHIFYHCLSTCCIVGISDSAIVKLYVD